MMIMMMVIALFAHRRDFANIPLAYDAHQPQPRPYCKQKTLPMLLHRQQEQPV